MDSRLGGTYGTQTDSQAFTDLNRLAQLKGKNRDSEENVKKVAQEFESLFINQMMKSMRSANEVLADKDSPFNSETAKQYQEMYDQQLALNLSRNNGGIGLASTLERQLSHKASSVGRKNPFAQAQDAAATDAASAAPGDSGKARSGSLWSSSKKLAAVDPARDDSKLLNARRLSLPGSIAQRIAAGIVPSADGDSGNVQTIAQQLAVDVPKTSARNPFAPSGSDDRVASATRSTGRLSHAQAVATTSDNPTFKSKADFVNTMLPMAEAAAKRIGVDPRYLVAQAALETGWGKHMIKQSDGSSANNLFGIKSHGWGGTTVTAETQEYEHGKPVREVAKFRTYDSYAESFHDYVDFLQSNGRYQDALANNGNSDQFMRELQNAGYATDPHYARKVSQIARNIDTYQSIQTEAVQVAASGTGTTNL